MDFAPAQIERLLCYATGLPTDDLTCPNDLVWACLQHQRTLAPTLFSAWARAHGDVLDPMLRHLLAVEEDRRDLYADLLADLRAIVPSLVTVKGAEIAARYPPGIMRWAADLDLMAGSELEFWRIAEGVVQRGWTPKSLTIAFTAGATAMVLSFHRPPVDRYAPPCGVDLNTHPFLGDLRGTRIQGFPSACRADTDVKNLVLLLEERFQQPFRARDLLDAGVLLESLRPRGRGGLYAALDDLGYWPEYAELLDELSGAALLDIAEWRPRDLRKRVRRQLMIRRLRRIAVALHPIGGPLRRYQQALLSGRSGHLPRRWWSLLLRRVRVQTGLRAGALAFGLPIEPGPVAVPALRLVHRRQWSWAITPIGVFLLSLGAEIPEDALEDMPGTETPGG